MSIILTSLAVALATAIWMKMPESRFEVKTTGWKLEYDYIIVGGGSAGATLAARLSEDRHVDILLIEAGGVDDLTSTIPMAAGSMQMSPLDWAYKTEPQELACLGLKNHTSLWPRGKALGGSSTLNYMLYVRGNKRDYDLWERDGAKGWSYQDVLPYFLKLEDNVISKIRPNGFHASGGPLTVSMASDRTKLGIAFPEAGKYLGYANDDYNGVSQMTFSAPQATIRRGSRCSSARAFLEPATKNTNLHILIKSYVTKILFNKSKRAIGVQFDHDGLSEVVHARREIIIAGGAINSAQLLLLSGIGPREHLKQLGIPVISDRPVGKNLQDHVHASVFFTVKKNVSLNSEQVTSLDNLRQFFFEGRGPLTIPAGIEGVGFVATKYANHSDTWPDIQILMSSSSPISDGGAFVRRHLGISELMWQTVFVPNLGRETFTIMPVLLRPKSRGYIKLRSKDPAEAPIIAPEYLSDDNDLLTLIEGLKISIALGLSPAYRKFGSELFETVIPGCEIYETYSNDYLACASRTMTSSAYDPCCTCRMGDPGDSSSVVDPHLRVIGVKGLRVADASVMPNLISGNLNAASIMIGERCADFIKGRKLRRMNPNSHVPHRQKFKSTGKVYSPNLIRQKKVVETTMKIVREKLGSLSEIQLQQVLEEEKESKKNDVQ